MVVGGTSGVADLRTWVESLESRYKSEKEVRYIGLLDQHHRALSSSIMLGFVRIEPIRHYQAVQRLPMDFHSGKRDLLPSALFVRPMEGKG